MSCGLPALVAFKREGHMHFVATEYRVLVSFAALLALQACPAIAQQTIQTGSTTETYAGKSMLPLPTGEAAPALPGADDTIFGINKQLQRDIVDRAYPLMSVKWPFNRIFVCWEENDPRFENERKQVRQAIHDS